MIGLTGVTVSYGAVTALAGVSEDVPAGQWLAVIGPNGPASQPCSAASRIWPGTRGGSRSTAGRSPGCPAASLPAWSPMCPRHLCCRRR